MNNSMLCEIINHFSLYCHRATHVGRPSSSDMFLLTELGLLLVRERDEHEFGHWQAGYSGHINYLCTD